MQLSRVLQNLILRDLMSYLIPGSIALLSFSVFDVHTLSEVINASIRVRDTIGLTLFNLVLIGIAYLTGNLLFNISYQLSERFRRHKSDTAPAAVISLLKEKMPDLEDLSEYKEDPTDCISELCMSYISDNDPDHYERFVERDTNFLNMSVSMAGSSFVWVIMIIFAFDSWWKLWSLAPLFLSLYCFYLSYDSVRRMHSNAFTQYMHMRAHPKSK